MCVYSTPIQSHTCCFVLLLENSKTYVGEGVRGEWALRYCLSRERPWLQPRPRCWEQASMTHKASDVEERTALSITVCRNGAVNVHNRESDRAHSVLLDERGEVTQCSCKGHKFHGHCYHADEVVSRPLVVSMAQASSRTYNTPVATDGGKPRITHHREPEDVGGERYARCEGCGSESIFGEDKILHDRECEHFGRKEATRSERPDMGGGESTGVVDL